MKKINILAILLEGGSRIWLFDLFSKVEESHCSLMFPKKSLWMQKNTKNPLIGLWIKKRNSDRDCVSFELGDFIKWLDEYVLKEIGEKVKIVSTDDNPFDENYNPVIEKRGEMFIVASMGKPLFKKDYPILFF